MCLREKTSVCEDDNPGSHTIQIRSSNLLVSPRYKNSNSNEISFFCWGHTLRQNWCFYHVYIYTIWLTIWYRYICTLYSIYINIMKTNLHIIYSYSIHKRTVHYTCSRTGWQRPIGCLIIIGHLPQKSPIISVSFAKNDLQLQACYGSSPPCLNCCRMYCCV